MFGTALNKWMYPKRRAYPIHWGDVEDLAGATKRAYHGDYVGAAKTAYPVAKRIVSGSLGPRMVRPLPNPRKRKRTGPQRGRVSKIVRIPRPIPRMAPSGRRKVFRGKYVYAGGFNHPKSRKTSLYALQGSSMRIESAGTISVDKCLYIGHGTGATSQILRVLCQAIIRKLAMKNGFKPTSIDDAVEFGYTAASPPIGLQYRYNQNMGTQAQGTITVTIANGGDQSWADIAQTLKASIVATFSESDVSLIVHEITMTRYTNDTGTGEQRTANIATMDLRNCKFTMSALSVLKIQNRTRAHTEAGLESAAAAQSVLNVENNPIDGKVFQKKGNGFMLKNLDDATNSLTLTQDYNSGLINGGDIDTVGISTNQLNILKRPPSRHAFIGKVIEGRVKLQPGEIKSSSVSYEKTMTVSNMFKALLGRMDNNQYRWFWPCNSKLFAFEKMMHTDDAEEPDMSIGYEINSWYRGFIKESRVKFGIHHVTL